MSWTASDLDALAAAEELLIATARTDGTRRAAVPIWVVRVGDDAYVRTWHRRDTGWFGRAVRDGRARVRVPGIEETVVSVDDVGAAEHRAAIDAAYATKYRRYGHATVDRMTSDDAAAATLRLRPR